MSGLLGFTLADLAGAVDSRKRDYANLISELDDVSLEMIASKYGFKYVEHPIDAIKNAGFDVIEKDAGRYGMAEKELLVFDPATLKILDKKRVSK